MTRRGWQVPTRRWSTYPSLTTLTGTFTLDHSDSGNLWHSSGTLFGKSWSWVLGEIFLTLTLTSAPWPRFQMGGCLIDIFFKTFKSWVPWVSLKEWAFSICYFWENSIGGTTPTKFPNFVNVPIIWSWASKIIKIFADHRNDQNSPRSNKIIKICPLIHPQSHSYSSDIFKNLGSKIRIYKNYPRWTSGSICKCVAETLTEKRVLQQKFKHLEVIAHIFNLHHHPLHEGCKNVIVGQIVMIMKK